MTTTNLLTDFVAAYDALEAVKKLTPTTPRAVQARGNKKAEAECLVFRTYCLAAKHFESILDAERTDAKGDKAAYLNAKEYLSYRAMPLEELMTLALT